MTARPRVLVVASDVEYRRALAAALADRGHDVFEAADRADCTRLLASFRPHVVVVDVQATGELAALPEHTRVPIVTIANRPSGAALRSLSARSTQVLTKPVDPKLVHEAVVRALSGAAPRPLTPTSGYEPRSPAMLALLDEVERLRDSDCSVLILGETGTGKTVLARKLHTIGARPGGNFVDLNCAGLSNEFFESELFGHERGSFTGAHATKQGLLDVAHGGTLFLDEIGDIDLRVQPKVLKVLEEKRFRRMGDVRERAVDVRLLAATHHDLLESVANRAFRADLYYRISAIKLVVPPLRERREDIVPLAMEMLQKAGLGVALSSDAEDRLTDYPWPGNIRELKNVIESSAILRPGAVLTADTLRFDRLSPESERRLATALPIAAAEPAATPTPPPLLGTEATSTTRAELERAHIQLVLDAENGRVERAAQRLGIPRSTLYWKLKRYGLKGGRPSVAAE